MLGAICLITIFTIGFSGATSPPADESRCSPPLWHYKVGDNWPLPTFKKSRASFRLMVKGIGKDNIYTQDKKYTVVVKVLRQKKTTKRINGFELTVSNADNSCGNGTFSKSRGKKATKAVIKNDCNSVVLDGTEDIIKVIGLKYTAPSCGCVTLSVMIKASDEHLYYDDEENPEISDEHKLLIQKVCPPKE